MKITKVKDKEYKGKTYYRYRMYIPEKIMQDAGFKTGDELDCNVVNNEIILKRKEV